MSVDVEWLFGDDVGMSAECIWRTMNYVAEPDQWPGAYPHDPADLGRCIRLLREHPEWSSRIEEMAAHNRVWKAYVSRWNELVDSYENEELHRGARMGWSAPKTYALMKLIEASA